jgi:transposase
VSPARDTGSPRGTRARLLRSRPTGVRDRTGRSRDAKLARAAGLAPIPVSSGRTDRHRLDRGGNRQINAAIHRVAVTRARCHPETIEFLARKKTEGKTHREAVRSLKRHLARRIWQLLRANSSSRGGPLRSSE